MTSVPLEIRRATPDDVDDLWPLVREFGVSFAAKRAVFLKILREVIARDDTLVLVAVSRGRVVGYLLASIHATFFANGPVAWVEEVMVAEGARRSGAGSALVAGAEEWASVSGAVYVSLASRRAGDFYRALDYEESAVFFKKAVPGDRIVVRAES